MSIVLAIMGESGSGKTTSMRNLDPASTFYIDADKKGLSWRGWREQYNSEHKNYAKIDEPAKVKIWLEAINSRDEYKHIKTIVVDTINGIMVAEDMRKSKEKGYDKWIDLAQNIYDIIDYALVMRDDVRVVFVAHTQTDITDSGYLFTHIKTSGRKLDKICLESKFGTVLHSKVIDGKYVFETQANFSTAKSPMGLFDSKHIDNDIVAVLNALEEF